jgi:glycosyltransferase involved in cell wall biosynthesis
MKNDVTIVAEYVANEEVHKYFTASNVVILPYNEATQSGIMSISQSFGVPAIVTNVGGLGELLEDGKTGFIVEPRNVGVLAASIIRYFKEGREKEFSAEGDAPQQSEQFQYDRGSVQRISLRR